MRDISALGLAVLVVVTGPACERAEAVGEDGGGRVDSGMDASAVQPDGGLDVSSLRCEQLRDAWDEFVETHNRCTTASDCIVVGGTGSCSCRTAIGDPGGDAIAREARDASDEYLSRFEVCRDFFRTAYGETCDVAPAGRVRCRSNRCRAESRSCAAEDAGRDAAMDAGRDAASDAGFDAGDADVDADGSTGDAAARIDAAASDGG